MRLESNAQTEFSLTRVVNLTSYLPEGRGASQAETARVRWLKVIKDVRHLNAQSYS